MIAFLDRIKAYRDGLKRMRVLANERSAAREEEREERLQKLESDMQKARCVFSPFLPDQTCVPRCAHYEKGRIAGKCGGDGIVRDVVVPPRCKLWRGGAE